MRAVHVIEDIMSDATEKVEASTIEEAAKEVHRRTEAFPANMCFFDEDDLARFLGDNRLTPLPGQRKKVFSKTIPDAKCLGILGHRYYAFTSEHIPKGKILVFHGGWEAEGIASKGKEEFVYCIVDF